MSCGNYLQTRPVPACAETLTIGTVTLLNTVVNIYITKANGKKTVQEITTDGSGTVVLDLTDPSTLFYNEFDGVYTIQVGETYEEPLNVTVGTDISKTVGVSFVNISGSTETAVNLVAL